MGLGDNRKSPKMRRKQAQAALKARQKRQRTAGKTTTAEKPSKPAATTKKK